MLSPARAPSSGVPTLQDMSEEVELLREENAQLKRELALNRDRDLEAAFASRWRLTTHEAKLLSHLYRRGGSIVSRDGILTALYSDRIDEAPELKIVDVFVCKVRKKIGGDPIATTWGRGYSLSPYGRERCTETLEWFKRPEAIQLEAEDPPMPKINKTRTSGRYLALMRTLAESPKTARQLADGAGAETHLINAALLSMRKKGLLDVVDLVRGEHRALNVYGLTKAGKAWVEERRGLDA